MLTLEERIAAAHSLDNHASPNVRRSSVTDLHIRSLDTDGILTFDGLASATSSRSGSLSDGGVLSRDNGYDMGWYTERVMAGAFTQTLSRTPDVSFFVNHTGLAYARTTNGSLDLRENPDRGLEFTARVDTTLDGARDLAKRIEQGLVDQCSFAFRITDKTWDENRENLDITGVDLHRGDVSAVSYGANPATPIGARSLNALLTDLTLTDLDQLRDNPEAVALAARILAQDEPLDNQVERLSTDLARAVAFASRTKTTRR